MFSIITRFSSSLAETIQSTTTYYSAISSHSCHIERPTHQKCHHRNPKISQRQAVPPALHPHKVHPPPPKPSSPPKKNHAIHITALPTHTHLYQKQNTAPNATKQKKTQNPNPSNHAQPANPSFTAAENAQSYITRLTRRNVRSWRKNTPKLLYSNPW
jgi:hypothetical protein